MLRRPLNVVEWRISKLPYLGSALSVTPTLRVFVWRVERRQHFASQHSQRPGFIGKFVDNIKQEIAKNKEMKENLKKFRQEAEKLEHSEALKKARQKYQVVESEASRSTEILRERIGSLKDKVQDAIQEASKSDLAKKAEHLKQGISKTARNAADTISESGTKIGRTSAFRTISETAQAVKREIDESTLSGSVYRAPGKLRKRVEANGGSAAETAEVPANEEATGIELHKDFKFYQSWQNFKNNNAYMNKILSWKMRYDESDNPMIRASRFVTDKMSDIFGTVFQKTELSETLTEICKFDPAFDKSDFLKFCEQDVIPNILEAMVRGDLDILKDWCHEAPYNVISTPIKQAIQLGLRFDSKILDVDKTDLIMGKIMEHGPVLIITFQAQQIICLRDKTNKVVEGDPNKVLRVTYVWALCRDTAELNPKAAWKLLDMSANSNEQLV